VEEAEIKAIRGTLSDDADSLLAHFSIAAINEVWSVKNVRSAKPKITFIVVGKRCHPTFPCLPADIQPFAGTIFGFSQKTQGNLNF
jgi:hypothetical protein